MPKREEKKERERKHQEKYTIDEEGDCDVCDASDVVVVKFPNVPDHWICEDCLDDALEIIEDHS
jgi:hypothetical protein